MMTSRGIETADPTYLGADSRCLFLCYSRPIQNSCPQETQAMWLPRVSLGVEWINIPVLRSLRQRYRRPRFTVRSLTIVVAVAGLILSLVAYDSRSRVRQLALVRSAAASCPCHAFLD